MTAFLIAQAASAAGPTHIVRVYDSETGDAISHAAVFLKDSGVGVLTDGKGIAEIVALPGKSTVKISMTGYQPVEFELDEGKNVNEIGLTPMAVMLDEVEVHRGKERYSKRNNPAVDLMEMVRENAKSSDPDRLNYFNYDVYEKIVLAIEQRDKDGTSGHGGQLAFLREYADTSDLSSTPLLNISLKEKIASRHYRKEPFARKEVIDGVRRIGLDDFIDQGSIQNFLDDVLREVDVFNNDIVILQNRFVSPFSRIGADFYKYYITDSLTVDSLKCIELSFVPRTSESFGFTGKAYIVTGDSSYFVKEVILSVPRDINLNFVDRLQLSQQYRRDSIGTRIKEADRMSVKLSLIPGSPGIHVRRNTYYSSHDSLPAANEGVYSRPGPKYTKMVASRRRPDYWTEHRPVPLSTAESRLEEMVERLRSNPTYYWAEKFLRIFASGYIPTASDEAKSKFNIGPWNTLVSGNDIEGTRLRVGGMTTAALSPRWFGRGYVAYGTKDKRWKYGAELEYSFRDKEQHSREFPIHSIMLSHKYDVDMIGQHYEFTNPDNFVLSLTRIKNRLMTYHRVSQLKYTLETENHFSVIAGVKSERQEVGPFLPFVTAGGVSYSHYNETDFFVKLRYAPGESFFQTKSYRIPVNMDAPVITLEQSFGAKGFAGNRYEFNKTELGIQKRFWFSAFGYLDGIIKGGHIWSRVPYPSLHIPNSNISYTIQPESFALMNPMEFMSDSYAEWHFTYWANGAILNHIPLIKRLKLREVFSFSGYLGELSKKNRPDAVNDLFVFPDIAMATPMHGKPYMEVSVGLDNILRIFRVDYVWRASYRSVLGVDRQGVRVALHITF